MSSAAEGKFAKRAKWQSRLFGIGIGIGVLMIIVWILSIIKITDYFVYQNKVYGIQMNFPQYWSVQELPEKDALVIFMTPKSSEYDDFLENVSVTKNDLMGKTVSLATFTNTAITQLTGTFEGYIKVLENTRFELAGHPGHRFSYVGRGKDVENPLRYLHVWTIVGDRAYIITYAAREDQYDLYLNEVKTMIKSFKVLNAGQM